MVNPISLLNLVHQETKYTPALGKAAADKLEAGQTLTSVANELRISRASLRNWRSRDPRLNAAFATFEARKAEAKKKRKRVRHFKQVATEIVDAAREDAADPVEAGVKAQQEAKAKEAESKLSPEEARQKRLQVWW
ncbi:MAG: transposase, partial [Opitutales bacterium]